MVKGEVVGKIGPGLLAFLGVAKTDTRTDANYLVEKILGLRVFEDADGKMNLSLTDTHGAVLAVSRDDAGGVGERRAGDDSAGFQTFALRNESRPCQWKQEQT